ncbi:MAG: isocitrate lyase/phosphoenolpyruvate mutase family protein [Phycisphaerales bacterium]|nr:isocitrate lyase/phosphoenolpyruvate mutase family protein [Phycisphaerales bacterium]
MKAGTVMCPGAFTALVARAVAQAGFKSVYISGGATANTAGYPDIGLISLTEMCRTIREVVTASGLPVVVDADTGYGEVEMVHRTVHEYAASGAAALHLEDQVFPKRCGHLDGKTLVSTAQMVEKIEAAAQARDERGGDVIIIARTDAASVDGIDEAIKRGCAYREAGADMIFPEGLGSEEDFATFSSSCPGLLLANMTEFGKTPMMKLEQFQEMGYDLVIYPVTMQRVAMGAVTERLEQLAREGGADGFLDAMQTRSELYELLDYTPGKAWPMPSRS